MAAPAAGASSLPIIGSLAGALGPAGPLVVGIGALLAASPELRGVLADLGEALAPLAPAVAETVALIASGLAGAIAAVVPLLDPVVSLVGVLVDAFTSLPGPLQTATLAIVGFAAALRFAGPVGAALVAVGALVGLMQELAGETDAATVATQDLAEDLRRLVDRGRVTGELLRLSAESLDKLGGRLVRLGMPARPPHQSTSWTSRWR